MNVRELYDAIRNILHATWRLIFCFIAVCTLAVLFWPERPQPKVLQIDLDSPNAVRSVTGEAVPWHRVWYARRENGAFQLFDRSGTDPRTGRELSRLDSDEARAEVVAWINVQRHRRDSVNQSLLAKRQSDSTAEARRVDSQLEMRRLDSVTAARDWKRYRAETESLSTLRVRTDSVAAAHRRAESGQAKNDSLNSEIALVVAKARQLGSSLAPVREEWAVELRGKRVQIRFSSQSRGTAAEVYARVTAAGANADLVPLLDQSVIASPAVSYTQIQIHAGQALRALLADIGRFDLNSSRAGVPLTIVLP